MRMQEDAWETRFLQDVNSSHSVNVYQGQPSMGAILLFIVDADKGFRDPTGLSDKANRNSPDYSLLF